MSKMGKGFDVGFETGKEEGRIICQHTVGRVLKIAQHLCHDMKDDWTTDEGYFYAGKKFAQLYPKLQKLLVANKEME